MMDIEDEECVRDVKTWVEKVGDLRDLYTFPEGTLKDELSRLIVEENLLEEWME